MRSLVHQFLRFGLVGGLGLIVDLGVFNLLRATVFDPDRIHEGPVFAKIISTALAIVVNWIGNRYWTFREHRGPRVLREGVEFGVVSVGGLLIGLLCLFISHYVLDYTSILADNISSNVIGLALGTAFRFWLYRVWVFSPRRGEADQVVAGSAPRSRRRRSSSGPAHPASTPPAVVAPQSD